MGAGSSAKNDTHCLTDNSGLQNLRGEGKITHEDFQMDLFSKIIGVAALMQ